jgi:integrase
MLYWDKNVHVPTLPAVEEDKIRAIVAQIRSSRLKAAYPETLANLLRLCYECALRAGELTGLSVGDVFIYKGAAVKDSLRVANRHIDLTAEAKATIMAQVSHLRKKHSLEATKPLFPDKSGKVYDPRLLRYHLRKACPNRTLRFRIGEIRQAGICKFYENIKAPEMSPTSCLLRTAEFAGIRVKRTNLYPIVKRLKNYLYDIIIDYD